MENETLNLISQIESASEDSQRELCGYLLERLYGLSSYHSRGYLSLSKHRTTPHTEVKEKTLDNGVKAISVHTRGKDGVFVTFNSFLYQEAEE